jgi:flagellin-like hook-associated protein FlgL
MLAPVVEQLADEYAGKFVFAKVNTDENSAIPGKLGIRGGCSQQSQPSRKDTPMSDISLTSGIRSNLLSLQSTSTLLSRTQERLGTGKKVNSPIDNPTNYFTAQSLTNRSDDLSARLDGIAKGVNTVKAADAGIKSLTTLLKQAKGVAKDARALSSDTNDTQAMADREDLLEQFNDLLTQVDSLAKDSGYDGVNLLQSDNLTVEFAEKAGSSNIELTGFDASVGGTVVTIASQAEGADTWEGNDAIDSVISLLEDSEANLRTESKTLSSNLAVLTARQDFTKNLVNVLTTGASDLTNADLNEESANLLALNTQQSLAVNSLSLASQASQSVLRLLQ